MATMTKKYRAAIHTFARLKCHNNMTIDAVVDATLQARDLHGDALYGWLSRHGYIWRTRYQRWDLKK